MRVTGTTSGTSGMMKSLLRLAKSSMSPTCITTGEHSRRMLKKASLLTHPTPARQDALYPERGPSSLSLSLGERPRLSSTARIERAQFHRARSASKEGTWSLPTHPSEAARCASTAIVPGHPAHFSASSQRHEGGRGSFRQIDHEFVSGVGQQRIPETVL